MHQGELHHLSEIFEGCYRQNVVLSSKVWIFVQIFNTISQFRSHFNIIHADIDHEIGF